MKSNLKALVLSDIHLGHKTNKTEDIVYNLRRFFKIYHTDIITINMIIISGDIFDKLLPSNGSDLLLINKWIIELVTFASNYNIKLRVLHGTPSHDWNQFKIPYKLIEKLHDKIDIKYYDKLDIEYIEEFDINILYVPDEWRENSKLIFKDVKNKLKEHNLTKVDMAIMHGAFTFQLPPHIHNESILEPSDYLNIVKGPIIIGHVHDHRIMDRIYVPGSFDALTHADNNKKGGLIINFNITNNKISHKFLVNKYKLRFRTINVIGKSIDDISKQLSKIDDNKVQHVRLLINKDSSIAVNLNELQKQYPLLNLSIKDKDKVNHTDIINKHTKKVLNNAIKLNKDTIRDFVSNKLIEDKTDTVLKHNVLNELDAIL